MRLNRKLVYSLAAATLAAVLAAVLAGCSSGGSSGTPTGAPPEQPNIVLDVVPTADAAGIYIAYDDGFFKQQGLNVKINTVGGGEYAMPDLQDGKAQLIEGNYVSFIQAQVAGKFGLTAQTTKPINMRIIADTSQMLPGNQALYVMPNSPYKTVGQLARAHATIGVNTLHNIGAVLIGSLLAANGYKLSSIVQTPLNLPEMPQLLDEHKVDAAWMPEPFGTIAQQEYGALPIADFDQGALENFPIGCILGDTTWVKDHPNTVAAFLRAFQQGQEIADTQHAAVERALVQNKVAPSMEVAATMTIDTYPLDMDVPVMQRVPDAMYQFDLITKPYNITDMIQQEPGEVGLDSPTTSTSGSVR